MTAVEWKDFPDYAPTDGTPIIIGGFTEDGRWVDVIAHYGEFKDELNHICQHKHTLVPEHKWIIFSFLTLGNFAEVNFSLWCHKPAPPPLFNRS